MPKNPKKVSKFILKLVEILQVSVFLNLRMKNTKIASNGQKMEQGYKSKIENNFKTAFCLTISNSEKWQVLSANYTYMASIRPEIQTGSTFSSIHPLKNKWRTLIVNSAKIIVK